MPILDFTPRREAAEPSDPFDTSIKHLLEKVFKDNNHDGPVALAFKEAEITTITEFLALDKDDINELEFENSEGRTKKLSLMTRKKLKGAVAWGKIEPAGPLTRARWASVTTEDVLAAITQEQPSNVLSQVVLELFQSRCATKLRRESPDVCRTWGLNPRLRAP